MNAKQKTAAFLKFRNAKNNEEAMQDENTVCECCDRQVTGTIIHKGKAVCPACAQMRGAVLNRLESVLRSIREFNGSLAQFLNEGERLEVVGTADPVAKDESIKVVASLNDDLVADNEKLCREISELRKQPVDGNAPLITLALDLAQYAIDGKVVVASECFRALRKAVAA